MLCRLCFALEDVMGWEPITYCSECGDAFDVYQAPEDRICDCCKEFLAERETRATMAWFEIMNEERP